MVDWLWDVVVGKREKCRMTFRFHTGVQMDGGSNKGDGKKRCGFGWTGIEFQEQVGHSIEDAT